MSADYDALPRKNFNDRVVIVDEQDEAIYAIPPHLVTDSKAPRIRVDVGQTGFFAGREFRTFKKLNIANAATYVVRAVVPIDIILFGLELVIDNGHVEMYTKVGGVAGGAFAENLPIFNRNNMASRPTPLYTPQVLLTAGGTHSGGTELDIVRLKVENSSGAASSVGSTESDERGVAANTYYFVLSNIGSGIVEGTFKARWEERPVGI
jgi:hypothetical protein